jgi:hypothetical protein
MASYAGQDEIKLPSGKIFKLPPNANIPLDVTDEALMADLLRYSRTLPEGHSDKMYYSDFFPKTPGKRDAAPAVDPAANRRAALEDWGRELPNENNDNTFGGLLQRAGRAVVPDWLERGMMGVSRPITTASYRINQAADAAGLPVDEQEMQRRKFDVEAYRALPKGAADVGETALAKEDPLMGAAGGFIGNTVGLGATKLGGRAFNALRGRYADRAIRGTDEASDLARQMQREGFRVKPGEAHGRGWKQRLEGAIQHTPGLSWAYDHIDEVNQRWLNTRIGKAMGLTTDDLGPNALANARQVINREFDEVADHIGLIPVEPDLADDVLNLLRPRNIKKLGLGETLEKVAEPLKAALGKESFTLSDGIYIPTKMFTKKIKTMTGKQYMQLRSALGELASETKFDELKQVWNLIDELDELAESVARPGFKEAYAVARERYRTWLSADAYRRAIDSGDVNVKSFDAAFRKVFKSMYKENRDTVLPETRDMFNAARHMANKRFAVKTVWHRGRHWEFWRGRRLVLAHVLPNLHLKLFNAE